jgi:tellurite resistance protein TehA-like permease
VRSTFAANARGGLATFFPGYFALVMATGVVSLASYRHGLRSIAIALLALNVVGYLALWVLTVLRLVRWRAAFVHDLTHHARAATFLTTPAATCVLGGQFAVLTPWMRVAAGLWLFGLGLWLVLSYAFFTVITVREPKPSLDDGINGAWLLVIVAAESVSILGTLVAPSLGAPRAVLFVALTTHLVGAMLYVLFVTLILYRWMFFRMQPEKLTPDYWIDMGALAITTLAGAHLLRASAQWRLLREVAPFLEGFTLFFWAAGTWWIPLLLIVEVWRHLFGRVPLAYSPDYWSFVFPLGMYSVATFMLARVMRLPFLAKISTVFAALALVAWIVTFAGMVRGLLRPALQPKSAPP